MKINFTLQCVLNEYGLSFEQYDYLHWLSFDSKRVNIARLENNNRRGIIGDYTMYRIIITVGMEVYRDRIA